MKDHRLLNIQCKLLKGDDVCNMYKYPSKFTKSSMTGEKLGEHTRFYADNPEKVGLIVSYYNETPIARALVWECDDGTRILDQIYGIDAGRFSIHKWAIENKVFPIFDLRDKAARELRITMTIKSETVPYIDTFSYGEYNNDKGVTLSCCPHKTTNVVFNSHDGYCFWYD